MLPKIEQYHFQRKMHLTYFISEYKISRQRFHIFFPNSVIIDITALHISNIQIYPSNLLPLETSIISQIIRYFPFTTTVKYINS